MAIIFGCCSAVTKQEVPTNCTFPQKWEGSWFLSGSQQSVHIKGSLFSYRGRCMASDGNKYLIVGESGCHRCLVIYEKHTNVLQYKESECDGDSYYMDQNNNYNNPAAMPIRSIINSDRVGGAAHPNSRFSSLDPCMGSYDDPSYCKGREILRNLCDQIPGDAQLYSLFREQAEPVKCPLRGPYTFTYNRGHGECRNPVSNIDSCTEESRLLLSFQACPDVQGTESTVEELTCLATWKDGNSRYLVGLVSHHHAITNEDRFRCFVYEKISTMIGSFQNQNNNPSLKDAEYKLAQSGDATCNGLDSAEVGSRIMTLRKPTPTERCDFPVWLKGPRHWYSLKGNFGYQFHSSDGSMHITRPNGYTDTRAFCEQINKQTLNEMTAVVHFTSGCKKGFMCMSFYRRDINIAEIQMGQPASRLEDACLPDHFDVARMSYVTLLASNSETSKCPTDGLYHLLGAIGPPNLISRHKRNHNNNNNNNNNHYYNGLYGENIYEHEKHQQQQQHGHHQYHHHVHHPHHQHNHHHNQHYYYNNNNNQELKGHKRHDLINHQITSSRNDNTDTKNVQILSHQNSQNLIPLTDADSMAIRNRRYIERINSTNFINDNTLSNHTTTLNNSLNSNSKNNSNDNKNHNSNDNNSNIGDIKSTLANVNKFEHSSKNINMRNENIKTITTAPITDDNELKLLHKSKTNNSSEYFSNNGNSKTTNSFDNQMILESSTISNNNNQLHHQLNIKSTTSNVINTVIDKVNTTTLIKLNASNEPSNEEKSHHVEGQHEQLQKHENYNNHSYSTEHYQKQHHKHYNHHNHHHHQHPKHANLSKHHKINYQSNNHNNHYHQQQHQQQHEKYRDLKHHVHKQHTAYNDINDANSNQHSHHRQQSITATTSTIENEKNEKKSIEIYNEFEYQQQQPQRNRRDVPGCTVNYKIQRELRIGCTDSNQIDVRPQCSDDNEVYICYGSWTENMNTYIVARNLGTQRLICLTYIPFIGNQAKLVIGDECYYHSYEKQSDHLIMTNITRFGQCGDSSDSVKLKFNQLLIYLLPMMLIITTHLMYSIR